MLTPLRKVPLGLAPYGEGGKVGFAAGHGSDTDCSSDNSCSSSDGDCCDATVARASVRSGMVVVNRWTGCAHAAVQLPSGCVGRASAPLWKVTAPHWEVCDRTRMVVFIGATELTRACLAWQVPQVAEPLMLGAL